MKRLNADGDMRADGAADTPTVAVVPLDGSVYDKMSLIRLWLETMRYNPSLLTCQTEGDRVVARVEFAVASQAVALAERFAGSVIPRAADAGDNSAAHSE